MKVIEFLEDHIFPIVIGLIILIIAAIGIVLAIPVQKEMKIESYHWHWSIQLYEYKATTDDAWGQTESRLWGGKGTSDEKRAVPGDAYNIHASYEQYDKKKVIDRTWKDDNGIEHEEYHYEKVYRWHYYYTVNRWVPVSSVDSYGNDKEPYEAECEYPTDVSNPNLGDIKRQHGHSESYTVSGQVEDEWYTYEVNKSVYDNIYVGAEIAYKKYRLGKTIFDVQIYE